MEQKFTKHLIDIGLIDKKTETQILSLYRENYYKFYKPKKLIFNELMTEILLSIINNLTEIQKKFLCFHLPAKFIKLSNKNLKDKLKTILRNKEIKNTLIMSRFLFKWYKNKNQSQKKVPIDKNIFRQKSSKNNIKNNCNNKNYINSNIKNFLFNNNNDNNVIINNYQSNLNTLNNEKKNKTFHSTIKKKNINKTQKKILFLYDKDILNDKDINFLNNNIFIDKTNPTIENKKIFANHINYKKQIKEIKKGNNKNSDNDTILSGFIDSNESNENCLSTNLNTINNRYNNNQENKTLSQSEYLPNYDIKANYNNNTYKKIVTNYSNLKSKINEKDNNNYYYQQKNNIKKNKKKNKSNLIQNILYEDFGKHLTPIAKSKTKKINDNNIFNLIYYNNYNNLNNNNYFNDEYLINYKTPFCQTIKNSKSTTVNTTCRRLFEDGKKRIKEHNQRIREQEKYIDDMARSVSGEKKNVNFERINYLYRSKERSNTYEKTKSKVEQEEGLTFKPLINKNIYSKRIYGNFMERNLSNKSKDNCVKDYDYINSNINNNKKLNKRQKAIIVNGVINRLYSNSLIKSMSTNCNKYTKGNNHSNLIPYKKKL